jgi:hypothetical protein
MEAALNAEHGAGDLPENLAAQLRAAVRMLREALDEPGGPAKDRLEAVQRQLQTPPMVFLPHHVTKAAESARVLVDRALNQP